MKKTYKTKISYTNDFDFEDALINGVCQLCDRITKNKKKGGLKKWKNILN